MRARPEAAVECFRLLGGGVPGYFVERSKSQLAIVPGATHMTLIQRTDVLPPMLLAFLAND